MIKALLLRIFLTLLTLISIASLGAQSPQLGRLSFPTSGTGPAQSTFERGVLYLHNFEYDEAILAFRDARRQLPGFAMAYWGEALSYTQPLWYNEQLTRARDVLNQLGPTPAARAAKAPTPREKAYLAAIERLFGAGNRIVRFRAFAEVLPSSFAIIRTTTKRACFRRWRCLRPFPRGHGVRRSR